MVKVLDFGLAKAVNTDEAPVVTATRAVIIVGTPAYMAPEQAVARDGPRWDELPAETPAVILRPLWRCLDKDPKRWLRDIGEARIALE